VLVQVALIAFALSGFLALAVDIGFARLSQNQMQNAADSAALEGLRKRDAVRNPVNGNPIAFASDCARRAAANRIAHWTFDDDFDPASGDVDYQFGAGPVLDVTEGVTSVHALQTISVPDPHVYKPDLQLNQQNQVYGDMVSGRFCYTSDPFPSEGGTYELQDIVCTEPQHGSGAYSRNDFNPNLTVPTGPAALSECPAPDEAAPTPFPPGGTGNLGTADDSAFLVRLRRSNDFVGEVGQAEAGVGSSGPSLPLTFGKGTTIRGDDPLTDYSVRRDGLTVHATAIAATRPAMHLGAPQANPATPSITPFVLGDTCVQSATGAAVTITVSINPANGMMTRTGPGAPGCATGAVVGRFVANAGTLRTIGQAPPAAGIPRPCAGTLSFPVRYGPISSQMTTGPNRIVGFAEVGFTRAPACPGNPNAPFPATLTRRASTVAPFNATAILSEGFPVGVPPALVPELVAKNLVATGQVNYGPVLVPVLAR
jgi:putative Flp pilus-assembly TadE/G-like protein